ncbi:kelch-like protein 24a [Babylonia areolata]|uniref:kelch-like protein 24a n=1 Tax=Babylonia areolata TaxID=304850 RepID=UPI003FD68765
MAWKGKIAASVLEGMQRCFAHDVFTDIEIEVDNEVFKCHKVFLCAISDFFRAMFLSGMKESVNNRIQLSGLTSSTFRDVLTFYYEGDDQVITHDTVEELLRAAGLLQLECLQARCEAYYTDHLYPENALGIWKLAACLGCKELELVARAFILHQFGAVSQEAEFLTLELEPLLELIGDSDLKVSSEDVVCTAAVKWIKQDLACRGQHLDDIVGRLCLHLLSFNCYSTLLAFSKFTCASCSTMLPEHPRLIALAGTSSELKLGRHSRNYEEMLVVMGVHKSTKMLPGVHAYSFNSSTWYKLQPLPFDPGVGYATCVHNNQIYISGISLRRGYMLKYESEDNLWVEVSEMPDRRRYHELVVTGASVYAVGGCTKRDGASDVVMCYSIEEDSWKPVGHLQLTVYSASATMVDNVILVFGGRAQGGVRRKEIQGYNIRTNASFVIGRFSLPVTESKALTVGNEAFVALTNGNVVRVSEDGAIYPHANLPNFDRYNFGFVHRLDGLLIVGGETRYPSGSGLGHFEDFIQLETDSSKTTTLSHQLFASASAACCCMVILRRSALPKLAQQSHNL